MPTSGYRSVLPDHSGGAKKRLELLQARIAEPMPDTDQLPRPSPRVVGAFQEHGPVHKFLGRFVEKNDPVPVAIVHPLVQLEIDRHVAPSVTGHDDVAAAAEKLMEAKMDVRIYSPLIPGQPFGFILETASADSVADNVSAHRAHKESEVSKL
jgi:hypothetical protein